MTSQPEVAAGMDHSFQIAQAWVQGRQKHGTESALGLPINPHRQMAIGVFNAWQASSREGEHATW